ncbi:unnamed protein product [Arctia plantaginis]|uniref:Larval cuticle protein LCP-17-like n=1 Tax=Arctia plantaginis TaxID=874455 RepID=A0A8S1B8K0_ARCPL|nr:unnamed protein product [Arctia plantaginis]
MKFFILATIVSLAAADVSHIVGKDERGAQILRQEQAVDPEGSYQWAYETDNGIAANEVGTIKVISEDTVAKVAQGQASWTAPNGEKVDFTYIADENGYQPQGDILPTPPPIPLEILRALQYIKDHPSPPEAQQN